MNLPLWQELSPNFFTILPRFDGIDPIDVTGKGRFGYRQAGVNQGKRAGQTVCGTLSLRTVFCARFARGSGACNLLSPRLSGHAQITLRSVSLVIRGFCPSCRL